jgi:hypothetical protein
VTDRSAPTEAQAAERKAIELVKYVTAEASTQRRKSDGGQAAEKVARPMRSQADPAEPADGGKPGPGRARAPDPGSAPSDRLRRGR